MMQIKSFTFNPFQENTLVAFDETNEAVIFDPGCFEKQEYLTLTDFIEENKLTVKYLINTHCHIDHVLGNAYIKRKFQIPLWIHRNEIPVLKSVSAYAPSYGFPGYEEVVADGFITEKDTIKFGNTSLEIRFVPGHAPGHLVFYHQPSKTCIGGDTLFRDSIGRTDLPGGDPQTLLNAIKKQLFTLPDDTVVYPGHGPTTKIGYEKENNPFVGKRSRN